VIQLITQKDSKLSAPPVTLLVGSTMQPKESLKQHWQANW